MAVFLREDFSIQFLDGPHGSVFPVFTYLAIWWLLPFLDYISSVTNSVGFLLLLVLQHLGCFLRKNGLSCSVHGNISNNFLDLHEITWMINLLPSLLPGFPLARHCLWCSMGFVLPPHVCFILLVKNFLMTGSILPATHFLMSPDAIRHVTHSLGHNYCWSLTRLASFVFTCLALEGIWVWDLYVMAYSSNITSPQYPPSSLHGTSLLHLLHLVAPLFAMPWVSPFASALGLPMSPVPVSLILSHHLLLSNSRSHLRNFVYIVFFTCDFFRFLFLHAAPISSTKSKYKCNFLQKSFLLIPLHLI